jgi:para-aminobenzoate synthetase/4-amino-4-deoxychorismate lyase
MEARFDDLTPGGTSFRLRDPVGVLEATRLDEVAGAIEAADAAAARGLWVAGFVTYEAGSALDASLAVRTSRSEDAFATLPLAWFGMFERREETALPEPREAAPGGGAWRPSIARERYDEAIAIIREHIAAGDTYQVNFTMRLRSTLTGDPRGLYRDLCFAQRGAHAGYVDTGRHRILSASPELFFRLDGRTITTRPMKGTAPRGRWPDEDAARAAALIASEKDRAENAMIVDLLRNDLGRVARPGSVGWDRVFEAERYETVWQLTSTVTAELASGNGLVDVFRALFPSGSVTGAPKVSSMHIIAGLEDSQRGVYCGAVGWLAPQGAEGPTASFNVAIRTIAVDAATGLAEYGVGGGITWDSSATGEYDETVAKARVLTSRRPSFELLETLLHDPEDGYRRLDEHLDRLRSSAEYFGFAFDEHVVRGALTEAAASSLLKRVRVRLTLARSGSVGWGVLPMPASANDHVRIALDDHAVDPGDVLLFHKTTLRSRYEEARTRHPDADDVLLVNTRGEVTESTIANLAVRIEGTWWTPPLDCGLLPGTERAALLAEGTLSERVITLDEVRAADEIALVNSARPWRTATLR